MFAITEAVALELQATKAVNAGAIEKLVPLSISDDLGNWTLADFQALEFLTGPAAYAVYRIVQDHKVEAPLEFTRAELPTRPSYLERPEDYDPANPAQFWTSPTGEMYRWDGKGRGEDSAQPWGKRRRVVQMPHRTTADGVQVPDPERIAEVLREVQRLQADWFHRGFGCWINPSGKPYGQVTPATRDRVVRAIRSLQDNPYTAAA